MNKESNAAVVDEMEHEDIIYDDPGEDIQDEQDGELNGDDDNFLKIVAEGKATCRKIPLL